jgi:hypothetical protein
MQERRAYVRMPLAVSLEMFSSDEQTSIGKGFVTNISESGAALETAKLLGAGDKLLLRFSLAKDIVFSIAAEIKYVKDGIFSRAYGASFMGADPETASKFRDFITQHV